MFTASQQPNPLDGYEVVPDEARVAVEALFRIYDKLGFDENMRSEDIVASKPALRFMEEIADVWVRLYPQESREWFSSIEKELQVEKSVREMVKGQTGHSIISIPPRLYQMFMVFFPNANISNRKLATELARRLKKLKVTNYEI